MAAAASSTSVAWVFVRISREPIDDLKEVLRQCLFGQCLIVAPELPPDLREERGVCHRIYRCGVDPAGDRPRATAGRRLCRTHDEPSPLIAAPLAPRAARGVIAACWQAQMSHGTETKWAAEAALITPLCPAAVPSRADALW